MTNKDKESENFGLTDVPKNAIIAYTVKMTEVDKEDKKAYCKKAVKDNGKTASCFVKFYRGKMFDPWGMYSGREKVVDLEYRKVSEKAFNLYSKYLKTRNHKCFLQSEREVL
jgi:hypothetical protein